MTMGEKIKHLREAKGLTLNELSQASAVPYFTLTNLEGGKQKSTNVKYTLALAQALGVSLEWLIDDSMGIEGGQDA